MKKTTLITILLILSVSLAFANGNKEDVTTGEIELEKVTITGPINFVGFGGEVTINDGGTTYYLMYPHHLDTDIDLDEGESVTIEGYVMPVEDENEKFIHVTKAVIRGEEYDLENEYGFGFMGGRGPGGCWMTIEEFDVEDLDEYDFMFKGRRGGRGGRGHMRF